MSVTGGTTPAGSFTRPLGRITDRFLPVGMDPASDEAFRARVAIGAALLLAPVFAVLAVAHAVARSLLEAGINLLLALLMAAGPFAVHRTGRYERVTQAFTTVVFVAVVLVVALQRGAGINAGTIALAEIPLFAALTLGIRAGAVWAALSTLAGVALGVLQHYGHVRDVRSAEHSLLDDHVTLAVITGTLFLVAVMYEWNRARRLEQIAQLEVESRRAEIERMQAVASAQVARSERLASLGRIAAAVAHEVNNPLAYVAQNLEAARRTVPDGDVRHMLDDALDGVRRVARIVADLKGYTRSSEGGSNTVDVERAIHTALQMVQGHLRSKAEPVLTIDDLPRAAGEETRVLQVLLNLLVNAAQALPEGRIGENQILVRARAGDDCVVIEIEDNGPGLPPEIAARPGEPFVTTRAEGTGLGLFVCQSIVDALGGRFELDSAPGRTVARVSLRPAVDPTSGVSRVAPAALPAERPARVLIVDDEPLIGRSIERLLPGHDVTRVTSGRQALELLREHDYDVVLCDMMMPDLTGMDVFHALAHERPEVLPALVFMTGGTFSERADEFRAGLANAVLDKPIDPRALDALIAERVRAAPRVAQHGS